MECVQWFLPRLSAARLTGLGRAGICNARPFEKPAQLSLSLLAGAQSRQFLPNLAPPTPAASPTFSALRPPNSRYLPLFCSPSRTPWNTGSRAYPTRSEICALITDQRESWCSIFVLGLAVWIVLHQSANAYTVHYSYKRTPMIHNEVPTVCFSDLSERSHQHNCLVSTLLGMSRNTALRYETPGGPRTAQQKPDAVFCLPLSAQVAL
jgi:hypothetical protein